MIVDPTRWVCHVEGCAVRTELWACLSCGFIACGRRQRSHMLQHFEAAAHRHPLCLDINEHACFCYLCDDYVLVDTVVDDIALLREALSRVQRHEIRCGPRSRP